MIRAMKIALAGCALCAAGLTGLAPVQTVSAMPVSVQSAYQAIIGDRVGLPIVNVAKRHRYNRKRHGKRLRSRRGRHRHYRNGYWYAVPFWLGAAAVSSATSSAGGRCEYKSRLCAQNWGNGGPDYEGCMRYEGCD